jgi:hypothetical protein
MHIRDNGLREQHGWPLVGRIVIPALLQLGGRSIKSEQREKMVGNMILLRSQY